MLLSQIIGNFPTKDKIKNNLEICSLSFYSKKKLEKGIFFCLEGKNKDGKEFAEEAIKNGAVCVVSSVSLDVNVENVVVDDVRSALAHFSANFYFNPQNYLKIIGVVGTNGKTSTATIIRKIFEHIGENCASIGTLGVHYKNYVFSTDLTTPDPIDLFATLNQLKELGARYVVMELSAHAIALKKAEPIKFEQLLFTNCTQDHLDYFESFAEYRQAKKSAFISDCAKCYIVNSDDELGREICLSLQHKAISYGIKSPSDVFAIDVVTSKKGINYIININDNIYEIESKLIGEFSVYNTMLAIVATEYFGVKMEKIKNAISKIDCVLGRMEKIASYKGADIYIDYAHTPDGLEKSLLALRSIAKGNLVCLFGCGGNRDKSKRKIMGKVAGDIADFVVVTSDNPRFEDASMIIADIEAGVREATFDFASFVSRKRAIEYAMKMLKNGDLLLIAGKGAENYQEIMGVKHEFNDKNVVLEIINNA